MKATLRVEEKENGCMVFVNYPGKEICIPRLTIVEALNVVFYTNIIPEVIDEFEFTEGFTKEIESYLEKVTCTARS